MLAALARLNRDSSYVYFLELPPFTLLSTCGLTQVRRLREEVCTVVLAGTRPRGRDREEDELIERELRASRKDRAEHVMLVDLERNDLSRVAQPGTLRVPALFDVVKYGYTQYQKSVVEIRLRDGTDNADLLVATGPRGVVTGVPKRRAMEIIASCEPERRAFYAGTVFCAQPDGSLDSCVVVTAALATHGRLFIQVGSGVTVLSEEGAELEELAAKSASLLQASSAISEAAAPRAAMS